MLKSKGYNRAATREGNDAQRKQDHVLHRCQTALAAVQSSRQSAVAAEELEEAYQELRGMKHLESSNSNLSNKNALACCRIAGRLGRYEEVVQAADRILLDKTTTKPRAVALGYKGYALWKLQDYEQALVVLEEAQNAFLAKPPKSKLAQQVEGVVEAAILNCCNQMGREPPHPPMIKFPRTSHLFKPEGSTAVSSDDKVLPENHEMLRLLCDGTTIVTLEEKVDGANLGISMYNGSFYVQNRSHYIGGGEHAQYDQVTAYLEEHRDALTQILAPNTDNPRRTRILYGEWLVARHSIPYGKLPGYFMAFDILDLSEGRFLSRKKFHTELHGSGIPVCPILANRAFGPYRRVEQMQKELLRFIDQTPSAFRTDGGPIEGVVIRVDNEDWLVERCKLVRPDFVGGCAEGHWFKRAIEKQRLDYDFSGGYMQTCYSLTDTSAHDLPCNVENPRQRVVVTLDAHHDANPSMKIVTGNTVVRESQVVLPRNLCWLWRDEVAVSSTPKNAQEIRAFAEALNMGLVLTLTQEQPLASDWFSEDIRNMFYPITNGCSPTLRQMDDIGDEVVRTVVSGKAVLLHCGGGKGRAGTVASCLMLRFGLDGVRNRLDAENRTETCRCLQWLPPQVTSEGAIQTVRQRRPGSLETVSQESFVRAYADHLWRVAQEQDDALDRAQSNDSDEQATRSVSSTNTASPRPSFIVLAGIPSSGKSTIGRLLAQNPIGSRSWIHASQDELGRQACQNVVGQESRRVGNGKVGGIIVDCCNVRASERAAWIDIMHNPEPKRTALVFVDTSVDVCVARVQTRIDHPSIPFGRGERIVRGFADRLEPPTGRDKALFGQVVVIRTPQDGTRLMKHWGVDTDA